MQTRPPTAGPFIVVALGVAITVGSYFWIDQRQTVPSPTVFDAVVLEPRVALFSGWSGWRCFVVVEVRTTPPQKVAVEHPHERCLALTTPGEAVKVLAPDTWRGWRLKP